MELDAMILVFWMLSFKPTFSLSSFTFIKRLFSYSLSAIRVVSSAYLRLLIFLPAILIPACASSSPVFLMMYSAYKLKKQSDNIQPWCIPFPIYLGQGNGTPLQYSCLENPMDGGAWWASVCGVAQSQTWLNNLAAAVAAEYIMRNAGLEEA